MNSQSARQKAHTNVFPTLDFKPRDPRKVTLFANTGEAIVFWLSLGGLIFVAIVTLFRYFTAERLGRDYSVLESSQLELRSTWEKQSSIMSAQIDSLKQELEKSRREIAALNVALMQTGVKDSASQKNPARPQKPVSTERRNRLFLETFKIERPQ